MESTLLQSLANQAPGVIGVIIVVMIFIRYLEKRDTLFLTQLAAVVTRIEELEKIIQQHMILYQERGKIIERIDKKINKRYV